MKECRAQNVTCNGCGIKGHLKKCCKKSGNFPKDDSNRQNQSSSTGPGKMNIASAAPQIQADFFDEKGVLKEYIPQNQQQYQHTGSMFILKKVQDPNNAILLSEDGVEIQHSVPESVPAPVPSPDFPFQEFPLTEVVNQSLIDSSSISDTLNPRESSNSLRKATKSTDLPLKSGLDSSSDEEMRESRDLTVSTAPTQSSRDSNTISISDNSATRESIPGITSRFMTDTPSNPTTFPVETDVTEIPEEVQMHSSNYRSVMPTDIQALTVLQIPVFYNVPVSPGNPPHSSILRLECIFYIFYSSIGFHRNSTEYQLGNYKHYKLQTFILQRKGDVVISVKHASVKMSR